VLSTLHTNDASSAVARLVDMGVEPYLVAATVEGLLAQRLLRRCCPSCVREVPVRPEHALLLEGLGLSELQSFHEGQGCEDCKQLGYLGRTAIFEVIPVDDTLRELATQAASPVKLRHYVRQQGVRSLRDDGLRLVRLGKTTPAEVARVTRAG